MKRMSEPEGFSHALPILIVDDNPDDIFFLTRLLTKAQIPNRVLTADSGEAAITLLEEALVQDRASTTALPGLVLLDMKMPGMSGVDLLHWARQSGISDRVAFVMHTSTSRAEDAQTCLEAGAHAFLVKYPDQDTLLELVRQTCHRPPGSPQGPVRIDGATHLFERSDRQVHLR
jgi:CheY-like chemotaxis protein